MSSPHRSKETSARWNNTDRDVFKERANAGLIDIDDTTLAYIESIRLKYWITKRPDTFRANFRTRAAELRTDQEVAGQRAGKSLCICMRRPLSLNSPFHAVRPAAAALTPTRKTTTPRHWRR